MTRTLRAQLVAALVVVAALLPGSAFGRTRFFCRMMNRVVATCCCRSDAPRVDPACAEIRATDCCQKIASDRRSTPATSSEMNCRVPPATPSALGVTGVAGVRRGFDVTIASIRARAPPALGPPLFIAHCSFLT